MYQRLQNVRIASARATDTDDAEVHLATAVAYRHHLWGHRSTIALMAGEILQSIDRILHAVSATSLLITNAHSPIDVLVLLLLHLMLQLIFILGICMV